MDKQYISRFYLRFAKTVFEHWGEYIDYYLPFNEINAGYFSPYNGVGLVKERKIDHTIKV
ncbi:MAG: hypothetical protein ACLSEA_16615 [Thomasclavelia ramosa]